MLGCFIHERNRGNSVAKRVRPFVQSKHVVGASCSTRGTTLNANIHQESVWCVCVCVSSNTRDITSSSRLLTVKIVLAVVA